jgi:MFS family permease
MPVENVTRQTVAPSRVRHTVLGFAATLAVITYVDRVCIAQAAPFIQRDLGLSASQMGIAFAAFSLAYAIFEIPGGWLGDLVGPRKVLMRVVVMWSTFTALTAMRGMRRRWWSRDFSLAPARRDVFRTSPRRS